MKLKQTLLVVEGSGDFPVDMLRYDSCVPWGDRDSDKVSRGHELRCVALRRFSTTGRGATATRWRSFGWRVLWENATSVELPADLHNTFTDGWADA